MEPEAAQEPTPEQAKFDMLLNFFKALGNESRLKIVGMLANRECTVGELSAMLNLREPTVSQHLGMLKYAGLVEMRPVGNHHYYSFNTRALLDMSKEIFSREKIASLVSNFEEVSDAWERKVLETFFDGQQFTQLPANDKKYAVIIRWLARKFEVGVRYPEKQINEILTRYYHDYATLRRSLVDLGYMEREKGIYWRTSKSADS